MNIHLTVEPAAIQNVKFRTENESREILLLLHYASTGQMTILGSPGPVYYDINLKLLTNDIQFCVACPSSYGRGKGTNENYPKFMNADPCKT